MMSPQTTLLLLSVVATPVLPVHPDIDETIREGASLDLQCPVGSVDIGGVCVQVDLPELWRPEVAVDTPCAHGFVKKEGHCVQVEFPVVKVGHTQWRVNDDDDLNSSITDGRVVVDKSNMSAARPVCDDILAKLMVFAGGLILR